ncbi:hypothetical protein [Cardiobacterium valvarum]|uniref:hypothetical protein n=1 Tax=Cardiobacterium valvarum TaxID=194702 RepID=UPI0002F921A3|nr:hypothetical protein [Cardiobacterium valvarum]
MNSNAGAAFSHIQITPSQEGGQIKTPITDAATYMHKEIACQLGTPDMTYTNADQTGAKAHTRRIGEKKTAG